MVIQFTYRTKEGSPVDTTLTQQVLSSLRRNWNCVLHPAGPRDQWRRELLALFPGYPVWNWTDFNYDKCHTYSVILHKGTLKRPRSMAEETALLAELGGKLTYLWVAFSVVAPYFLLYTEVRTPNPDGEVDLQVVTDALYQSDVDRLRAFAAQHGYVELPDEVLQVTVPDVELDLKPRGMVTIYNCLFYDEDD